VSSGALTIDRAWLRDQLDHLERLASWARVRPRRDAAGRLAGFELVALRRDSPLATLGVRAGDVLTAVDGQPLDSPNVVLAALDRLPDADRVAVEVERAGRRRTLEYRLR
jgi:type II secretory pathway component PulC